MSFFNTPYDIPNSAFGTRIFRRRIRIEKRGDTIAAGLEDTVHACKISMVVEDGIVREIEGKWYRHPNRCCLGAAQQLRAFVGKRITAERETYRAYVDSRQQCTHFHDLLGIAFSDVLRAQPVRQYDITIPDPVDGVTIAELQVDGATMLCWTIDQHSVIAPAELKGKSLERGFGRWVREIYTGDLFEAAHILQMGIYVSRASALDFVAMAEKHPGTVLSPPALIGACYAMQPERNHLALPEHDIRDFTDTADRMLSFL